jgi:hypothetical protein
MQIENNTISTESAIENGQDPKPEQSPIVTDAAKHMKRCSSAERWATLVKDAERKAGVLFAVTQHVEAGLSERQAVKRVGVPRPTLQYWSRQVRQGDGPVWERLLYKRMPPEPKTVPDCVRLAIPGLRVANPGMSCEEARKLLIGKYGAEGAVSDTYLKRIWAANGLAREPGGLVPKRTEVRYEGGAGLVFLNAAVHETQAPQKLGKAVVEGREEILAQDAGVEKVLSEVGGRDDWGRFTPEYNKNVRAGLEPGALDPRLASDNVKRDHRRLSSLALATSNEETIANKLLALGSVFLLTERRGCDGVDTHRGRQFELLDIHAYKSRTLDKFLGEMAVLGVADALWEAHAITWTGYAKSWAGNDAGWKQYALIPRQLFPEVAEPLP